MYTVKTKDMFNRVLDEYKSRTIIFKFSACWCGPCRALAETIKKLEDKMPQHIFVEIDVDEADEELVEQFNVRSIPMLVFYKDGEEKSRKLGNIPESELEQIINEI